MTEEFMAGLKFGPDGFSNIALVGTASASMELAPVRDPSWAIWVVAPAAYSFAAKNRSDVYFETHRWQPSKPGQVGAPGTKPWFSSEFHLFLQQHKGPVFMSAVDPTIPTSVRIPFEYLIDKHGPYFWQSSVSWMLALAIEVLEPRAARGEDVAIGLFGIEMSATEEYAYQRPSCQHFVGLAKSKGIKVVLPPESDLMRPGTMYGYGELNPRHIKMSAKLAEINANLQNHSQAMQQHQMEMVKLQGHKAELEYWMASWADDIVIDEKQAVSFSGHFAKEIGAIYKKEDDAAS